MKTLVLVEHDNLHLKDATLATVTAASKLGEVHLLVAGSGCRAVAEEAANIAGVGKVHLADDAAYEHQLAENVAPLAAQLMADHDAFLAPATTTGKNIAPRLAALLDVMQVSDIIAVEGERTFKRPIYAGNAIATVESSDPKLSSPSAAPRSKRPRPKTARQPSKTFRVQVTRASPASSASKPRKASGPS